MVELNHGPHTDSPDNAERWKEQKMTRQLIRFATLLPMGLLILLASQMAMCKTAEPPPKCIKIEVSESYEDVAESRDNYSYAISAMLKRAGITVAEKGDKKCDTVFSVKATGRAIPGTYIGTPSTLYTGARVKLAVTLKRSDSVLASKTFDVKLDPPKFGRGHAEPKSAPFGVIMDECEFFPWLVKTISEVWGPKQAANASLYPLREHFNNSTKWKAGEYRTQLQRYVLRLGDPAVDVFISALADPSWSMRQSAAQMLGHSKSPRAVDPLIKALGDPEEYVRWDAIRSLVEIGDSRAVSELRKVAVSGPDKITRDHAKDAADELENSGKAKGTDGGSSSPK